MDVIATPPQQQTTYQSRLLLSTDLDELPQLSAWIDRVQQDVGLAQEIRFGLELALTETVTNVISHAYSSGQHHPVEISLELGLDRIEVLVIDSGKAFDPSQATAVALPQTLNEAGHGGLGLHMIRGFTDACHYRRKGEKNHFTMVFLLD